MSPNPRFMGLNARREPASAARRRQSTSRAGVDVRIYGWRAGIRKVTLSQTFRAGGKTLTEAAELTGQIMKGEAVEVHLTQFDTLEHAREVLTEIGVKEVCAPEPEPEPDPTPSPGP